MKSLTRSQLIKRIDTLRQTCARYHGAKKSKGEWVNTCVTCGRILPCSKQNGGHWVGRTCYPLRWHPLNVHCQCPHCNLHLSGNPIAYNKFIIDTYGMDTFNQITDTYLRWKAGKIPAFKMSELKDIYDEWLAEGRKLEKKTGLELFPKTWLPFGPDFIK